MFSRWRFAQHFGALSRAYGDSTVLHSGHGLVVHRS